MNDAMRVSIQWTWSSELGWKAGVKQMFRPVGSSKEIVTVSGVCGRLGAPSPNF